MHYLFDAFTKYLNLTLLLIAMCAMVNTIGLYICISNWIPPMSLIVQICRAILISYWTVLIYGLLRSWKAIIGNIFVLIIPFVVYMSPVMKNKHSALAERINASVNKEINTTNLTYTLMDITGVYIKGHNEDNKNSFFY